jgi:heme/copper-type cytochrome/quinol oxidase subunit 3
MSEVAALGAGTAPEPIERPRVTLVGTTMVAAAIGMFFAGLLGTYLRVRAQTRSFTGEWFTDVAVDLPSPSIVMVTLAMGAVAAHWALWAITHHDRRNGYVALALTLFLGVASLNSIAYNWSQMGFVLDTQVQAVLVYTITGAHVAMLLVAMGFIALMAVRALAGQFRQGQSDGLASAVLFWDAMTVIYAVIFYAVYVTR